MSAVMNRNDGVKLFYAGDYDDAIQKFDKSIDANPKIYEAYLNRAACWRAKREYRNAISDYNKAIGIEPRKIGPLILRGTAKEKLSEYDSAIEDFTAAIDLSDDAEDKAFGFACRASIHRKKKNLDSATKDIERAFELDPDDYRPYLGRGLVLKSRKHYGKAIAEYTLALEKQPHSYETKREMAWMFATCPEDQYRDGKKAVELAEDALRLSNDVNYCTIALAAAFAECGKFDSAVQELERVLEDSHVTDEEQTTAKKMLVEFRAKRPFRDAE